MKLVLGEEGHILTGLFHRVDEIAADFEGVGVHLVFLEFDEGCLEEVNVFVDFFLLAFIVALALVGGLVGDFGGDIAQKLGHFAEISRWLPVLPTDFHKREGGRI